MAHLVKYLQRRRRAHIVIYAWDARPLDCR